MGISQKKELLNRLTTLLEHLLKRIYVNIPYDYNGWERTIRTQREKLEVLLIQVPSLKSKWEIAFTQAWKIALKTVKAEDSQVNFPLVSLFIAVFSRMRGNRILERLTVHDCNTPHSCDYRYIRAGRKGYEKV